MAQYCRYCINMYCGDANWCSEKDKEYTDEYIKHTNNCKFFELNPIDALFENEKGYKPRAKKEKYFEEVKLF